ncbi:glutaminyl-tRNA synthase (glutamine-hydrolyzing) subunit A [Candidatus Roizmanbacteria bacterium RIFCSPHIGHO2_02_FULL_40_13b]|uniref:Glutamyl-tRNA(Gln) amidotransferase subunit A n=1 Tax=Candidatus Roizmanbacteria bacterium RIFCSPHIGHO2_01_FULL_39_24 TaxID=1802032 RepID=A0A1F7GFJ5_9BACT|nr:MAG: glutaminyl-tRNA synthase (glutamine-hydrolyzing) subunit A [Candidatus Roizmanbacteria bacterium RIFCSPHIGHO2_01_FULL_39_24]OGK26429.1 MAG: glutaminyl-tRNA synthase (glutamine-hydrolyzing) subunit A [Candidatus Roizmanbacteria bacterium RIFCSPHIGHO2_02_FULL_40_13b]OGK49041.1 MAG: glutaminyl-tRNA synthase (glutamine-hydrolyzing) subunit A [Candidatus Roizmanbacteria bacterium RIFCSPLOWO2_01_FULL_40_32]OGK57527.1 MAG: glutaminyl-tRNA synthase (glutamine-hydrolyzing) subunit A [Candidatus R
MINTRDLTIKGTLELLKKKEISVEELVSSCLNIIESKNPEINAVLTVNENALDEAQQFSNLTPLRPRLREGAAISQFNNKPLLGIPIILKDAYSTKGLRTTAASKVLENYIPPFDATVVKKLKEAGAIILGKANMDAWAHGSSGENSDFGPTKNPYDLSRTPGGSSSGSAAALAAGMSLASTGTDTGGSIRLPASFTNLVGLKPTYGRVSRYGIIAMGSSFDSIGHFTKDVYDNALILSVTAGHDSLDGTTSKLDVPKYHLKLETSMRGKKIGIVKEFTHSGIDSKVDEVTQKTIKTMERLGGEFIEVSLPHVEYAIETYYILVPAEVSSNLGRMTGTRFGKGRELFGDEAKRRIMIGTYTLSSGYYDAYYNKALKVRTRIKQDFDQAFEKVDALLCPVSPTLPFKLGEKANDPLAMYLSDIFVAPMNLAGVPALSVPAGSVEGLPVGIQFVTKQFDEQLLYQVAYAYEQARGPIENLKINT